jgi:hypothetical protein
VIGEIGVTPLSRGSLLRTANTWPRESPCARPQVLVKGRPGVRLEPSVAFQGGRKHLPVVTLKRVV